MSGKAVRARVVTGALLAAGVVAALAVAPPAYAAAGVATVTDHDAAGHVVGQQFDSWLDTDSCMSNLLAAGTVAVEIGNGTLTDVAVYDDPSCGGTPVDVVRTGQHKEVALPLGDVPISLMPG